MKPERPIVDLIFEVTDISFFNDILFEVTLTTTEALPEILPGQFAQVLVSGSSGVFLRRPISIYKHTSHSISLLIQVAGKGTSVLAAAKIGDQWSVLLPLGNHFLPPHGRKPLLIGGGVGVAPLLALGQYLKDSLSIQPTFLLGARQAELFPNLKDFETLGRLLITTEDGSRGERGYVTSHSVLHSEIFSEVYTCGPTPMMKAVAKWCKAEEVPCQASLENTMACGLGVCLCCVEPTTDGHKAVCTEGPVFDTNKLLW